MNKKGRYILLNILKSDGGNSRIAKPKRGELPLTQKVKNTVNKKFLGITFKIRNCF